MDKAVSRYSFETTLGNGNVVVTEFTASSEQIAWAMYKILADDLGWTGNSQATIVYIIAWF